MPKEFLPEKMTVKDVRKKIKSGVDLKRFVAATNRATQKTLRPVVTEAGRPTTKWALGEAERAVKIINAQREKDRQRLLALQEESSRIMGAEIKDAYKPKLSPQKIGVSGWTKYVQSFEQASSTYQANKEAQYVKNYKSALKNIFGGRWANDIIKLLNQLTDKAIYEAAAYNPDTSVENIYDEFTALRERHDIIMDAWEWVVAGTQYA